MLLKKIVLLGTAYPYRGGGIATFNEMLAKEFHRQGWNICIYNFSLQYPQFLFPGKSQYSDEKDTLPTEIQNFRKVNSINPFNWLKIGYELYREAPDLLLFRYWLPFMSPCFSTIAFIAKLNRKTKVVSVVDNAISHEPKIYDHLLTKLFFWICDYFIAMSKKVVEDFKTLSNKDCAFHFHPMYDSYGEKKERTLALKELDLDPNYNYILYFGFIREYKGIDILIKAIDKEFFKTHKLKLIIAGEFYVDSQPYYDLADSLDLADFIIWRTSFIPDSQISAYFSSVECVILPYKSATQSGITQIAYSYLLPIVATDVGGLGELVADNYTGYVVESSPIAIKSAIAEYISKNKKDEFSNNMIEERKKFTWESFVKQIINTSKM